MLSYHRMYRLLIFLLVGSQCRVCGMSPICGVRYRCVNCIDYDLCAQCEQLQQQQQQQLEQHTWLHVFVKIPKPLPLPPWSTGSSPSVPVSPTTAAPLSPTFPLPKEPLLPVLYPPTMYVSLITYQSLFIACFSTTFLFTSRSHN